MAPAMATTLPTAVTTTTTLGKGQAQLMPAEGVMEVGQKCEESEREKWNCQPLD